MQFSIILSFKKELRSENGSLYYVVSDNGKKHQVNSGYIINKKFWNKNAGIIYADKNDNAKKALLHTEWEMKQILNILISQYQNYGTASLRNLPKMLHQIREKQSLVQFTLRITENLNKNNRFRTSETYLSSLTKFLHFLKARDISLYEITTEMIEKYEYYLLNNGLSQNTSAFYIKTLRAIYNKAVCEKIIPENNPFKIAFTGIAQTKKRAISCYLIRKIKKLNLENKPHLMFARDLFFLSFYLRGISFIDMAYLKKADIKNGYITYFRHKTGQKNHY